MKKNEGRRQVSDRANYFETDDLPRLSIFVSRPITGYTYCSLTYPSSPPVYFQLEKTSPITADCYCCPVCLLVYAPNYTLSYRETL